MGTDFTLLLCGLGPAVEPFEACFLICEVGKMKTVFSAS